MTTPVAPEYIATDTETVAFFDFDGTLTTRDSFMPFLKFVVGPVTYYSKLMFCLPVIALYMLKIIPNNVAKQFVLKVFLAGYNADKLDKKCAAFTTEVIPKMLNPQGMQYLQQHLQQGHCCVLVSASPEIYLRYWTAQHQFSATLATRLSLNADNTLTGTLDGENCFGPEKLSRIQQWLNGRSVKTYAYGDSRGDREMLAFADHPTKL